MKYNQLILVEVEDKIPTVFKISSDREILIEDVCEYFKQVKGWDEDKDSIIFLSNQITELII